MANLNNLFDLTKLCNEKNATLVAVSKTKPIEALQKVYNAGQRIFGENKVFEMVEKQEALPKDIKWHFIGHLQRNKVKHIIPFVDLIHGVDSERLAVEINKRAKAIDKNVRILLQMHIATESSKFGFSKEEITALLEDKALQKLENVEICGVMGMATFTDDKQQVAQEFQHLQSIFERLKANYFAEQESFKEISMGMTNDYDLALANGSTMIRVGSAIFGSRN